MRPIKRPANLARAMVGLAFQTVIGVVVFPMLRFQFQVAGTFYGRSFPTPPDKGQTFRGAQDDVQALERGERKPRDVVAFLGTTGGPEPLRWARALALGGPVQDPPRTVL